MRRNSSHQHQVKAKRTLLASAALLAFGLWQSIESFWIVGAVGVTIAIAYIMRSKLPKVELAFEFVQSVVNETRACTVPSRQQVIDSVWSVLWMVVLLSSYLFVVDLGTLKVLELVGVNQVEVPIDSDEGE